MQQSNGEPRRNEVQHPATSVIALAFLLVAVIAVQAIIRARQSNPVNKAAVKPPLTMPVVNVAGAQHLAMPTSAPNDVVTAKVFLLLKSSGGAQPIFVCPAVMPSDPPIPNRVLDWSSGE